MAEGNLNPLDRDRFIELMEAGRIREVTGESLNGPLAGAGVDRGVGIVGWS